MNQRSANVAGIVAEVLKVPPASIAADASMDTLEAWDSLAQINICMLLQERYGITLDIDAIEHATGVAQLAALLPG